MPAIHLESVAKIYRNSRRGVSATLEVDLTIEQGEFVFITGAQGSGKSTLMELFAECALLSLKLALPILGAELLGQVGMGVLMKAIPQINLFAINIELKVLIGLFMLLFLVTPMSEFLIEAEGVMLEELRNLLALSTAG